VNFVELLVFAVLHLTAPFHDEETSLVGCAVHQGDLLHDDVAEAMNVVFGICCSRHLIRPSRLQKRESPGANLAGHAGA
jgi:hypothetical protein